MCGNQTHVDVHGAHLHALGVYPETYMTLPMTDCYGLQFVWLLTEFCKCIVSIS